MSACKNPCEQCPWRTANQGEPHPHHFYDEENLTRLWEGLRKGGIKQSCHLTDPSDQQHVDAGAPLNATAQECPGSVIVVLRELRDVANEDAVIDVAGIESYKVRRPGGLLHVGLRYWVARYVTLRDSATPGLVSPLPRVDTDHPDIGLPAYLKEGLSE